MSWGGGGGTQFDGLRDSLRKMVRAAPGQTIDPAKLVQQLYATTPWTKQDLKKAKAVYPNNTAFWRSLGPGFSADGPLSNPKKVKFKAAHESTGMASAAEAAKLSLESMGFPSDQVAAALHAASGDKARAVEYLLNPSVRFSFLSLLPLSLPSARSLSLRGAVVHVLFPCFSPPFSPPSGVLCQAHRAWEIPPCRPTCFPHSTASAALVPASHGCT